MVGLVPDIAARFIHGKRNPDRNEVIKGFDGAEGFGQRDVPVDGAARGKRRRHLVGGVSRPIGKGKPVVRLFIRARVA